MATTKLIGIANRLGATGDHEAQLTRYRKESAAWHAWLDCYLILQHAESELYGTTPRWTILAALDRG